MRFLNPASLFKYVVATTIFLSRVNCDFVVGNVDIGGSYSYYVACPSNELTCYGWETGPIGYTIQDGVGMNFWMPWTLRIPRFQPVGTLFTKSQLYRGPPIITART